MALETGEVIDGKYRIIREIGSGAMGAVYEGDNVRIHRRVAIKVLHAGIAQKGDTVQRFEREAQAAGRIGSEHIVEVLDLGSLADGSYYMVMEFLEGMTLGQRIRTHGRLMPRDVVPVIQQLLTGLEAAHEARIIHRDLKPDNIFLLDPKQGRGEFVKILDFGVSKFNPLNTEEGFNMTRTGAVVGTPFYMSPEQAKGARDVDHRSDLYAVGVILYQCITGQVPFHAGTFNELIFKIVLETPPPPEQFVPNLDANFSRIVRRAMSREPDQRFQTAAEFRDTLSVWLHTGNQTLGGTMVVQPPLPPPPGAPAAVALEAVTMIAQPKPSTRPKAPEVGITPMPVTPVPGLVAQPLAPLDSGALSPSAGQREWILPTTTPTPPGGVAPAGQAAAKRRQMFAVLVAVGVAAVAVTAIAGIAMTGPGGAATTASGSSPDTASPDARAAVASPPTEAQPTTTSAATTSEAATSSEPAASASATPPATAETAAPPVTAPVPPPTAKVAVVDPNAARTAPPPPA
ncbi:MAG: protein kinase, partial [Polyangiaceae bacterium]|nr:protein kinase [Polyangiaceae bacterium]